MNDRKDLSAKLSSLQRQRQESGAGGYWRCLEELAETDAFQDLIRQEFPALADIWPDALSRRSFLGLMAASLGLAGVGGCSVKPAPRATSVPYVRPPEEVIPGVPLFFATTMVHDNDAVGLLVESHEGRPTKIEGNPDHPASLGSTNIFHQASVLTLYDPARSQTVVGSDDRIRSWDDARDAMTEAMSLTENARGARTRLLTENVLSPTLSWQIEQFLSRFPEAKWHQFQPVAATTNQPAANIAFGEPVDAVFEFENADVVLSLDADFLTEGAGHLRHARNFMSRRQVRTDVAKSAEATMNRLYVVETAVSCTGAKADHRLAVKMRDVEQIARSVASELGIAVSSQESSPHVAWAAAVARDLKAHAGRCVVLAGSRQPVAVHLLAHAINDHLGNQGNTIRYIQPVAARQVDPIDSLRQLTEEIDDGQVDTLFILGGNPAYTAPADFEFASRLKKVPHSFHLSVYEDETSRLCNWHLPEAHYLESWSDARSFDGTVSIAQPLIMPLYQGRSVHEVMAMIMGQSNIDGRELVRSHWRDQWPQKPDFETKWETALHDGFVPDSAHQTVSTVLQDGWQSHVEQDATELQTPNNPDGLELVFQADPSIHDGRFGNNGWLQELPKPITKLTWGNAAIMSPRTAKRLGLKYGSFAHGGEHGGYDVPMIRLQCNDHSADAPVWIMPGHADDSVTVYLGHGRKSAGRASGEWQQTLGFDAYSLRTSEHLWFASGLKLTALDTTYPLACTQAHQLMDKRDVIHSATLEQYRRNPRSAVEDDVAHEEKESDPTTPSVTFYESYDYDPPMRKWGMSIDTTSCTGCNACVIACQAENNIPVVGKQQVLFGREMHWLRIDRYLHGKLEEPDEFYFQPVPCMHCEHAPCEYVCPVEATVHSAEGLNDMIYNRCIGTRFCSNNCPYKVRRFNFLHYADFETLPSRLQYNPDVTVRSRGVMEKCTYCVQRIRHAEINAEAAQRPVRDGEVLTACQAACPTQAIVFGDMNDPQSDVRATKESPLDYALLGELNTFPRTTYLAALRNPNPELET